MGKNKDSDHAGISVHICICVRTVGLIRAMLISYVVVVDVVVKAQVEAHA